MTSTSLLAFCVGDPASASASSSDIVVPGSVTLPGRADFAGHEHAARLELIDLDAHLRVLEVARLQQRRDLVLRLGERQAGERHAAEIRHRDRAVGVDAVLAGQLRLVGDDDRQVVLRADHVALAVRVGGGSAVAAAGPSGLRNLEVRLVRWIGPARRLRRRLSGGGCVCGVCARSASAGDNGEAQAR